LHDPFRRHPSCCASTICAAPTSGPTVRCSKSGSTWAQLEDFPSNKIDGFTDRLTALLPALVEHHCGVGERGGFIQRLTEGTWSGHVLEHVVIELLNLAGMPTGFGQTRSTSEHGVYRMVFRARDEQVARTALAEGHRLLMAAINGDPFTAADVQAVDAVKAKVDDCYLGPSTASIVAAATDRGIPHIRLNERQPGAAGLRRQPAPHLDGRDRPTPAPSPNRIASDKDLTKSPAASLRRAGARRPGGRQRRRSLGSRRRTSACRWS
jgi:cyanophycin synthetase